MLWLQLSLLDGHSTAWLAVVVVTGDLKLCLGCRLIYSWEICRCCVYSQASLVADLPNDGDMATIDHLL
jgi:hypothetical protein